MQIARLKNDFWLKTLRPNFDYKLDYFDYKAASTGRGLDDKFWIIKLLIKNLLLPSKGFTRNDSKMIPNGSLSNLTKEFVCVASAFWTRSNYTAHILMTYSAR